MVATGQRLAEELQPGRALQVVVLHLLLHHLEAVLLLGGGPGAGFVPEGGFGAGDGLGAGA
jgi:hypothetical protein